MRSPRPSLIVQAVLLSLLLQGCANEVVKGSAGQTSDPASAGAADAIDFSSSPFSGSGIEVEDADSVAAMMPFHIYVPAGPSDPKVFISPEGTPKDFMALFFVFESKEYGPMWWGESLPDIPDEAQRLAYYDEVSSPGYETNSGVRSEVLRIRSGSPALLGVGPDGSYATLEWVEDGVQFVVLGPQLTRDQILTIVDAA